jgi:hypothetical protein
MRSATGSRSAAPPSLRVTAIDDAELVMVDAA